MWNWLWISIIFIIVGFVSWNATITQLQISFGKSFVVQISSETFSQESRSTSICRIKDRNVTITWAEPRKVDSDHERVRSVYVGNLPESATESKLKDIFKAYGNVSFLPSNDLDFREMQIEKVVLLPSRDGKSQRDYGFVHYVDRSCALKAVEAAELNPISIDDQRLQVPT